MNKLLLSKKGHGTMIIAVIILLAIIFFIVWPIVNSFLNPTGGGGGIWIDNNDEANKSLGNLTTELIYKKQVLQLSGFLKTLPKANVPRTDYPEDWKNISDILYASGVVAEFGGENVVTNLAKSPTKIRIYQKEIEDLVILYNGVVENAENMSENSTIGEVDMFVSKSGELSGKMLYVYWRDEQAKLTSFLNGLSSITESSWEQAKNSTDEWLSGLAGFLENGCNFFKDFIFWWDKTAYDKAGEGGAYALRGALLFSSKEEEFLKNNVSPEIRSITERIDLNSFELRHDEEYRRRE